MSELVISAGIRGWESIEFKELYASACEYLGDEAVFKHSLEDGVKVCFRPVKIAITKH